MAHNKLVQTVTNAATLTGLSAGYGWLAKKIVKEPVTGNSRCNAMNYVKFTTVGAAILAKERYLEDQKILPKPN